MNPKFRRALSQEPQANPPIWLMRQAGRYHSHYQGLRARHSFMELCKDPRLAAQVALGPVADFQFDVSILFSDLLFPLEALGLGLSYESDGPKLGRPLTEAVLSDLRPLQQALPSLEFQREALVETRKLLPKDVSLIGFVGGPWTLYVYAVEGSHSGSLVASKKNEALFRAFASRVTELLAENIRLQLEGGAEIVMIFDTAAGELSPDLFHRWVVPHLEKLCRAFPGRLGYYSKGTLPAHLKHPAFESAPWAGFGVDHRWPMAEFLSGAPGMPRLPGFKQGNFDQALLHQDPRDFERELRAYLAPILRLPEQARAGWVCGLGHGVLPKTPEENVRAFVRIVREVFQR